MKKPTIEDIARLAGVSRGTVSRVLNNRPDVDRETRAHVRRVIQEQGYAPSITAAGLAGGRNRLVVMLLPVFTWPILADLLRGITEILRQTPYELVLSPFNMQIISRARATPSTPPLSTHLTTRLLAVNPGPLFAQLTELYESGVPVVTIDEKQEPVTPWVRADDASGAFDA